MDCAPLHQLPLTELRQLLNVLLNHGMWEFPKIGDPYFGVLIIGILPFRVLYQGPLFRKLPCGGAWTLSPA